MRTLGLFIHGETLGSLSDHAFDFHLLPLDPEILAHTLDRALRSDRADYDSAQNWPDYERGNLAKQPGVLCYVSEMNTNCDLNRDQVNEWACNIDQGNAPLLLRLNVATESDLPRVRDQIVSIQAEPAMAIKPGFDVPPHKIR